MLELLGADALSPSEVSVLTCLDGLVNGMDAEPVWEENQGLAPVFIQ
jgi:hypothetical protein